MKVFLIFSLVFFVASSVRAEISLPIDFLTPTEKPFKMNCTDVDQDIYIGPKSVLIRGNYEWKSVVSIKHNQWNPDLREMTSKIETIRLLSDVNVSASKATVHSMEVDRCNDDENLKMGIYIVYYDATIERKDGKSLIDVWNDGEEPQSHKIIQTGLLCRLNVTGCQVRDL